MWPDDGPKVVEFNCRFGDPETQALMPLMDSSLLELIAAVAGGGSLSRARYPDWKPLCSVTTVVAAAGYPDRVRSGDVIHLPMVKYGLMGLAGWMFLGNMVMRRMIDMRI